MWYLGLIVVLFIGCAHGETAVDASANVEVTIAATPARYEKISLLIVAPEQTELVKRIVPLLKEKLERSGQCNVTLRENPLPTTRADISALKYPFVLFITPKKEGEGLEGRLYNGLDATIVLSQAWSKRATDDLWANAVAQDIWFPLFGNKGSFFSEITYVKRSPSRRMSRVLCGAHWDGVERVWRSTRAIITAPCWSQDGSVLFFSEFTDRNVRLMGLDRAKNCWVVVDGDGTYVGVSCPAGARSLVYCRSGDVWQYQYDEKKKQGVHALLIEDDETCASPTLLSNGDVLYCAQGKVKRWSAEKKKSATLTTGGYNTGPAYLQLADKVVYSKKVGKWMQLYTYDCCTGKHQQISFSEGNKIDPSWSPCGVYIAYCSERGRTSEIMVLNTITGDVRRISKQGDFCICPVWSPSIA